MKTLSTILILSLSILTNISCNKDDESQPEAAAAQKNSFFAKIDGNNYNPPFVTGFRMTSINNILLSGATGSNEEQIQISIPADIAPGTYTTFYDATVSPFLQAYYAPPTSQEAGDDGLADQGSLVITKHELASKTIEGTFNFNTKPASNSGNSWNITEGSFKIVYSDL